MLKSMVPRSVLILTTSEKSRDFLERFFRSQEWSVDLSPPYDLIVFDGAIGIDLLQELRRSGDETPGLLLGRRALRMRRFKHTLELRTPYTPDRLRDAVGALLRRRIKLVLKRKAS